MISHQGLGHWRPECDRYFQRGDLDPCDGRRDTAVDIAVTDTHLYWSGHSGGDIWRTNRDGTGAVQLITGGTSVHFLALNEASGKIYFSDYVTDLFYANLADGSGVTNFYKDFRGVHRAALDPAATFTDEVLALSTGNE